MRSPLLLTRGSNGARRTRLFARSHSSRKMPQSQFLTVVYRWEVKTEGEQISSPSVSFWMVTLLGVGI